LNREHKQFLRVASKPKKNAATWRVRLSTTMESEPTASHHPQLWARYSSKCAKVGLKHC